MQRGVPHRFAPSSAGHFSIGYSAGPGALQDIEKNGRVTNLPHGSFTEAFETCLI
ncbi:hypothetical protein RISK_000775 [Rhodopirellula islandica]|uniref:Uncharacterized protein n=1 Tax=Rhodopirellula islandica TaxID=595434 RepID=A0A0J1EN98_RHOIS|nr:hypothetical protein RISK_000775 [Rhodopirellula islandica]